MPQPPRRKKPGRQPGADLPLFLGLVAVVCFFIVSGIITFLNIRTIDRGTEQVIHTHEVLAALDDIVSLLKDAETGQRGYLISGDERYLTPYSNAVIRIDERISDVERLTADNPNQQARIPLLRTQVGVKLAELSETLPVRRTQGFEAARAIVLTDRGRVAMDAIRSQIEVMEQAEKTLRQERIKEMERAYSVSVGSGILTAMLGTLLSAAVAYLVQRNLRTRRREEWLQLGQVGLSEVLTGEQRAEKLGEKMIKFLSEYFDAQAGAFFILDGGRFRRVAAYGIPVTGVTVEGFAPGDGLLGQAVIDRRTFLLNDVPEGYISVGSAFGQSKPRYLVVTPFASEDAVNAVLELGFLQPVDESIMDLLGRISESVSTAVRSAAYRASLQNFLEETQRQAEELQAQSEELRVSNEELEEQGRALKESQSRLEIQQVELEQTNLQLEEQTQSLEVQRDEATRAKAEVLAQSRELKQASQYKSDFLANMSHELRTPLNSSLILSKLLADNAAGNLTTEQVKFAQTIQAAGNDLLSLINDILDLSKIESGHMEVRVEQTRLSQVFEDLSRTFLPVAEQKKLTFKTRVNPGCPDTIDTDRQRLEQVLKNLLSNALKFTDAGEVSIEVGSVPDDRVAFSVRDTGIGIPEHQQQIVFEAFRQADGTTNRKYGGTGLGLSIARELTRLLGGEIHLASEVGHGSTFTVTLPAVYSPDKVQARAPRTLDGSRLRNTPIKGSTPDLTFSIPDTVATRATRRIADDREKLTGGKRVILVVEDDESFANIMIDIAHELGFQSLVASTAEEGLALAAQHRPSAVILDVGLPDNSGLSVLDRLKQDARTRHIPVHVVSASDYSQTAFSLGAIGYMLKPVKREKLVDTLAQLETRLTQRMRRVLVVEDDPVQLDSLRKLLGSHEVETLGASSAAECLERLKGATFDCMVLDLSLPDASGYILLETLSREDAYSFPPVIVYTGRDLSVDEEQRLRRYSKSIIIKGAKSPERLLDEVTLFLHQMVSELPPEQQRMLEKARSRDAAIEGRRILIVEDDVRNVFALTSILEPRGAMVQIARNGREALEALERSQADPKQAVSLVLMDIMMPEMDGITATREIRKHDGWKKLPIIALTAKAMKDDQEQCLAAGANDYMAKPLDVEKLLSLIRVWMPR